MIRHLSFNGTTRYLKQVVQTPFFMDGSLGLFLKGGTNMNPAIRRKGRRKKKWGGGGGRRSDGRRRTRTLRLLPQLVSDRRVRRITPPPLAIRVGKEKKVIILERNS